MCTRWGCCCGICASSMAKNALLVMNRNASWESHHVWRATAYARPRPSQISTTLAPRLLSTFQEEPPRHEACSQQQGCCHQAGPKSAVPLPLTTRLLGATPQQQLDALSPPPSPMLPPSAPLCADDDDVAAAAAAGCGCFALLGGGGGKPKLPAKQPAGARSAPPAARVVRMLGELPYELRALIESMTAEDASTRIGLAEVSPAC